MKLISILLGLVFCLPAAFGQYRTETFEVKAGWTAFFLNVDPEQKTFDEIFVGNPDVLQVWQWTASGVDPSLVGGGDSSNAVSEWRVWIRGDEAGSSMSFPIPNTSYVIELAAGAADQTFSIKGRAMEPLVRFRTDGLNLVGFPIAEPGPQILSRYLSGAGLFDNNTTAFEFVGGAFDNTSNPIERPARLINARRGEAFWVRSDRFTNFYGPLSVDVALDDGLNYGTTGGLKRLVITNRTDVETTAVITPVDSESPPGGTGVPTAPGLTVQGRDEETGRFVYTPFGASQRLTIPARGQVGITIAIDRSSLIGGVDSQYAGLLKISDEQGNGETTTEIYLPVTAEQTGLAGLWLGEAHIDRVQNRLQKFQRNDDGSLVLDANGDAIPESEQIADLAKTAQTFKIRLLVHLDESGQATLLSQAFAGQGLNGDSVIATAEAMLDSTLIESASRLTTSHFPLDMVEDLTGAFSPSGQLTATVDLSASHQSNPFIHTYHPDHDNKDARFTSTPLPEGVESHRVTRAITMSFDATDVIGIGPSWGGSVLTGSFSEVITGLHKQALQTAGPLVFSKVTDTATLVR